jgi:hypothetical protein
VDHDASGGEEQRGATKGTNAMQLYDIFQEGERRAHLAIPDAGPPTWDYFPDEWGSQWMDDAIREGIVATITAAPSEAAWYYGELTIQPHTPA